MNLVKKKNTLPETNIGPEHKTSQKESSVSTTNCQGLHWFQGG